MDFHQLCDELPYNAGMSCQLISLATKELTTSSNCSGKQRHGVILNMQLSKKATLTKKKACLASPLLHL